jgi:hypothetical protein
MESNIILVSGDSWGAGIFDKQHSHGFYHGGITKCLIDHGMQVRNLCQPGGSNLSVCERIKNYLICNAHEVDNIKGIVFWQIEFFKDYYYYPQTHLKSELEKGYSTLKDQWIYRLYHQLNEYATQWNIPIYVVGGSSDTVWYDNFEQDFPGVKIVCQSVTNYLINGSHTISTPVHGEFITGMCEQFLTATKNKIKSNDLECLLKDIDLGHERLRQLTAHPELFFPDGIHPNQHAHNLVFKLLQKHIPELQKP